MGPKNETVSMLPVFKLNTVAQHEDNLAHEEFGWLNAEKSWMSHTVWAVCILKSKMGHATEL